MENVVKNVNLKGCLEWTLQLMRIAGYWIPKGTATSKSVIYGLYSALVVSGTLIAHTCTEIAYVVSMFGKLEGMIESLYLLLTHGMQCLKVFTFVTKRNKIYKLLDIIEQHALKPRNRRQFENAMRIIRYTDRVAKMLVILVVATVLFCCLYVVVDDPITKQLPTKARYPFHYKKSPFYGMTIAYQTVILGLCGCANAAMDMTAAAFISHICIQLDILSDSLRHIKEFAEIQTTTPSISNKIRGKDTISPELQKKMKDFLIECIRDHLKIKEFANEVQGIFSVQLFSQFLTAVGTICMTLFEMTTSSKLATSLYNSDWVDCSEDYKKMLPFAMANMQKEINVRVGGILTFSLATFVTALRSAWSYYLVLDQVRQG